jgi:hypothetical protein
MLPVRASIGVNEPLHHREPILQAGLSRDLDMDAHDLCCPDY